MKTIEDDPRPSDAYGKAASRSGATGTAQQETSSARDRETGEPDPWGWEARDAERLRSNEQIEPLRLTEAERMVLRRQAVRDLLRAIIVQIAVSIVVAVLAYAVSGSAAGLSALAGAAAYVIPNALFAFRLILSVQKPGEQTPQRFSSASSSRSPSLSCSSSQRRSSVVNGLFGPPFWRAWCVRSKASGWYWLSARKWIEDGGACGTSRPASREFQNQVVG